MAQKPKSLLNDTVQTGLQYDDDSDKGGWDLEEMKELDPEQDRGDELSDDDVTTPAESGSGWVDDDLNLPADFVLDPSALKADLSSEGFLYN